MCQCNRWRVLILLGPYDSNMNYHKGQGDGYFVLFLFF